VRLWQQHWPIIIIMLRVQNASILDIGLNKIPGPGEGAMDLDEYEDEIRELAGLSPKRHGGGSIGIGRERRSLVNQLVPEPVLR